MKQYCHVCKFMKWLKSWIEVKYFNEQKWQNELHFISSFFKKNELNY